MGNGAALQTIIGSAAVAALLLVQSWIQHRTGSRRHAETNGKLDTVEASVNGTHDELSARVEQLALALQTAGIEIPPSPPHVYKDGG